MYTIPASSVVGIDTTGYGLSITRIKAEIIASWQSKYKTSIRNQITMAAVAGQSKGKGRKGRGGVCGRRVLHALVAFNYTSQLASWCGRVQHANKWSKKCLPTCTHTHSAHTYRAHMCTHWLTVVLHSKRKYIGAFKYAKEVCT